MHRDRMPNWDGRSSPLSTPPSISLKWHVNMLSTSLDIDTILFSRSQAYWNWTLNLGSTLSTSVSLGPVDLHKCFALGSLRCCYLPCQGLSIGIDAWLYINHMSCK